MAGPFAVSAPTRCKRSISASRRNALIGGIGLLAHTLNFASTDAAAIPGDWIKVTVGGVLTLWAPPGTSFIPRDGTDSLVGSIRVPGFDLDVDYGTYSAPLTATDSFRRVETASILIDAKPGKTVRATLLKPANGMHYFFGLHVPFVKLGALGPLKLTMTANVARQEQIELMRRLIHTIRFKSAE